MQIPKILPFLNFTPAGSVKKSDRSLDRDPQQGGYQSPERQATEDEAKKAIEVLHSLKQITDNKLVLILIQEGLGFEISVQDASGNQLKRLKSGDVIRLLMTKVGDQSKESGRILDRRI